MITNNEEILGLVLGKKGSKVGGELGVSVAVSHEVLRALQNSQPTLRTKMAALASWGLMMEVADRQSSSPVSWRPSPVPLV